MSILTHQFVQPMWVDGVKTRHPFVFLVLPQMDRSRNLFQYGDFQVLFEVAIIVMEMCIEFCAIRSQLHVRTMTIETDVDGPSCLTNTDDVVFLASSCIDGSRCAGWSSLNSAPTIPLVVGDDACVVHVFRNC